MTEPAPGIGEPRVRALFATPVIAEIWPDAPKWNAALKQAILTRSTQDRGVAKSNLHGWQSGTDLDRWGGEAAQALRDHAIARAKEFAVDMRADSRGIEWVAEMWANVSKRGAANQTHAHPGSFWSTVYYVDDGYAGSPDKALGGELSFLDPRFPMVRMAAPDLRFRRDDGSVDNQEVWMRPRAGLVVMFPSWLMHSVRPYAGAGTRISIAINVLAREA
ncbi:2OG-Fe(II) oxygenase family protein [Sphingomonas sp. LT1P40]|uniref:2OG-Fe(II) oxygenase family protein n=1 Tax=Alteristakelama amylovorans TaxID=3096166 RepID=UPI002FCC83F3